MKSTVTRDDKHLIIIQQPNPLQPADVIRVPLGEVAQLLADIRSLVDDLEE